MTTTSGKRIDTKEDALKIANDPEVREIADAYALLARAHAGPRFTWRSQTSAKNNMRTYQCLHDSIRRCSPIGTLQALRITWKRLHLPVEKGYVNLPLMTPFVSFTIT